MFGSGNNQVAGYALSQLGDQNRIRLEQPVRHLELMLTLWARKILRLCAKFSGGYPIYVQGQSQGKAYMDWVEIKDADQYLVSAEIQPIFPNEETRKHAEASQVRNLLSETTIMERYLGIEQPDDEFERRQVESAMQHPAMKMYSMIVALDGLAKAGDKAAQMTLQALSKGGVAGEPGRPKEDPSPAGLTGLQSQNGEPVPQSVGGEMPGSSASEQMEGMANAAPNLSGGIG
jgi:hypothetical protein